jgi:hypothetical protein
MASSKIEVQALVGQVEALVQRVCELEERLDAVECRRPPLRCSVEFAAMFGTSSHPLTPRRIPGYSTRGF